MSGAIGMQANVDIDPTLQRFRSVTVDRRSTFPVNDEIGILECPVERNIEQCLAAQALRLKDRGKRPQRSAGHVGLWRTTGMRKISVVLRLMYLSQKTSQGVSARSLCVDERADLVKQVGPTLQPSGEAQEISTSNFRSYLESDRAEWSRATAAFLWGLVRHAAR